MTRISFYTNIIDFLDNQKKRDTFVVVIAAIFGYCLCLLCVSFLNIIISIRFKVALAFLIMFRVYIDLIQIYHGTGIRELKTMCGYFYGKFKNKRKLNE